MNAPAEASLVVPGTRAGSMREAWGLAWPTIIGQISVTVMWTVDTALLGQVGKVELAAAGFGGILVWTLYTFFVGTVGAVNTFVSQASGGDRPREAAVFTWQGLWLSLVGFGFVLLAIWQFDLILRLAGPEPDVIEQSLLYSRVRLLGAFFVFGTFTLQGFFRGIGDVRTPMAVSIAANLVNIVLDVVLIFGVGPVPRLTTLGAGIATAIAQVVSFAALFWIFLRPHLADRYHTRTAWRLHWPDLRRLLRVGVPMGAMQFGDMGAFAVFMALMGRLGTDQLAASQIGVQALSFSFMPASGVARAATTLVGQYLGAGRAAMAMRCGWVTLRMNLAYTLVVGVVFLLMGEWFFLPFNRDPAVVAAGVTVLPLLAMLQVFDGVQMTSGAALQGSGDTAVPMVVLIGSSWLLFVPLAWALAYPLGWGMTGAWAGGVVHFGVVAGFLLVRFARGRWQARTL